MSFDLMGHVVVGGARFADNGERILTAAQQVAQQAPVLERALQTIAMHPGHVVVGNGNLPSAVRDLVQRATVESGNPFSVTFERAMEMKSEPVPHASTLVRRCSNPCLMELNQNERERDSDRLRELRERNDRELGRLKNVGKDAALMVGCAWAGDEQGAMEHAINAGAGIMEPYVEATKSLWESAKTLFGWGD